MTSNLLIQSLVKDKSFVYYPVYVDDRLPDMEMVYHVFCEILTGDADQDAYMPVIRCTSWFKNGRFIIDDEDTKVYAWLDAIEASKFDI